MRLRGTAKPPAHVDHEHAAAHLPGSAFLACRRTTTGIAYTEAGRLGRIRSDAPRRCAVRTRRLFVRRREPPNLLRVGLATNFKAARFDLERRPPQILRDLEASIGTARFSANRRLDPAAGQAQGSRLGVRAAREVVPCCSPETTAASCPATASASIRDAVHTRPRDVEGGLRVGRGPVHLARRRPVAISCLSTSTPRPPAG